jgi:hypothetical protein
MPEKTLDHPPSFLDSDAITCQLTLDLFDAGQTGLQLCWQ